MAAAPPPAPAPGAERRRSSRLSSRLRDTLESSGFAQRLPLRGGCIEQCCACLLDVDAADEDGEFLAILECCQPLHHFHVNCILMWAEQENSCPQCKRRFQRIGIYGTAGNLLRVSRVEERDQNFEETDAEASDAEEVACQVCHKSTDEHKLLLCDGRGGRCNAAYHYYCVGLDDVPEGDWFCPTCVASRSTLTALSHGASASSLASQTSVEASGAECSSQESVLPQVVRAPRLWASVKFESRTLALDLDDSDEDVASAGAERQRSRPSSAPSPSAVKSEPREVASARAAPKRRGSTSSVGSSRGGAVAKRAKAGVKEEKTAVQSSGSTASPSSRGVKREASAGPEAFGGFCSEMPKWISRQGRNVRVDLGGRGVSDAAAAVLAKVVRGALGQVASPRLVVSMSLAGNRLQGPGLQALLEAASATGVRVEHLDLERNELGTGGGQSLARWCEAQAGGPPQELYLSHNRLGDVGACNVLVALGRSVAQRPAAAARRAAPLWVEARENGIRHVESILDALSNSVPLCLALDRSVCGPTRCAACEAAEAGAEAPRLHLPGIMDQTLRDVQDDAEEEEEEEEEPRPKTPKREAVKAEVQRCGRSGRPAVGRVVIKAEPRDASTPRRAPSRAASSSSSSSSSSSDDGGGAAPSSGVGRGRGGIAGGRGLSAEAAAAAAAAAAALGQRQGAEGSSGGAGGPPGLPEEPEMRTVHVPAEVLEAEERRSWAMSLGFKGQKVNSEDTFKPVVPASTGLWDMAFARDQQQRRARRLAAAKRRQQAAAKAPGAGQSPAAAQPLAQGSQGHVRLVNGHIVRGPPPPPPPPAEPPAAEPAEELEIELSQDAEAAIALALQDEPAPEAAASSSMVAPTAGGEASSAWVPLAWVPESMPLPLGGAGAPPDRGSGSGDEGGAGARAHARGGGDSPQLKELILARLRRERRLWQGEDEDERRVRRRCLQAQLCRKAQEKYAQLVSGPSAWEAYLRTSHGYKRTVQWVDRKIHEIVAKEASKARRR